jgi:glycogen debranching enzyme
MKEATLLKEAHAQALTILRNCATEKGFRASALAAGYPQVWARDSAITSLGAVVTADEQLITAARASLAILGDIRGVSVASRIDPLEC